ncbi:MAG: hypothetical protein AAGG11_12320 [Pseudomonadota bacterium]
MKKTVLVPSLLMAGLLAAGVASADPYGSWKGYRSSDDDQLTISDSFKDQSRYSTSVTEDNDVTKSLDYSSVYKTKEDNDVTTTVSEDNDSSLDFDLSSVYKTSEDNDITKHWTKSEDNDWTNTEDNDYTHSEDNDWTNTEDNDTAIDVDFQIATPTITSNKDQDQTAGHAASGTAFGTASGHSVGVTGGDTLISAGNDEQRFYGPAMVNNNTNQLPTNTANILGHNMAPISQSNTFAGRDMGPKGVFAPVGNTSASVGGNVGQQSGVSFDQAGDSANSIQDPITSGIRR